MSKNLASKAVSGLKWGSASTIANAVMQIGYTSAMARLLAPEAFGLVAIASVILRFGSYFAHLGLSQAIIQKEDLTQDNIRAAFTSSALLGLSFMLLIWALAPFATMFFENGSFESEEVTPIVRVMAFSLLIGGLSSTAFSLSERNMRFKELSIVETLSYVISYLCVGVLLAYLGYGVWSLVFATLTQAALVALGAYAITRHSILPHFKWESYKPLFNYGSKMSVISFLEFISQDMATILIGKTLGPYKLGIYDRAHRLVNLPMYMLTRTISRVIFPSFSKLQSETKKLASVYISSTTLLAAIIIPTCLGLLVAAPEVVYILLGDQWGESIPVLQVLCLAIPLSFITMFAGIVCDAKAVLNIKIVLTVVFIAVIAGFFFMFRQYGLIGFAFAVLAGELVRIAFYQTVMNRILKLPYLEQLQVYVPGLVNGVIIAAVIYGLSSVLRGIELPHVVTLAIQLITGAVLFLILTLFFPHKTLKAQIGKLLSKFGLDDNPTSYYGKIISKYRKDVIKST
ncbi:lipopolysaccharide biosynthesis protein [Pontibacter anaerobius]|uniref:Lipopolysaccharide biosynthesis protein n=1 Tax=Pontibacter anaerobius TaxID=2993940 RepID=A0ABT3RHZ3_9BACT|nr:lipopolysaccharide biosynthesis protein [Pontibacter anaerobius]MCX2741165.1 lipopolysaccharide biosynthesis protein [Pontibacter anaerobius]